MIGTVHCTTCGANLPVTITDPEPLNNVTDLEGVPVRNATKRTISLSRDHFKEHGLTDQQQQDMVLPQVDELLNGEE